MGTLEAPQDRHGGGLQDGSGDSGAMTGQGAQEAMAEQGALEAMAGLGALEAMAGGHHGRGLILRPSLYDRIFLAPPK